ncbi:unnamed protein product [Polarella glacialis]|uniref:Methyltransferase FkbM domain-containing protein n=1 Tax=Polarella glacialis TaxID=89957 RepID=A0A813G2L5_POLGL|nr:unnamed protein product [Polarella glacialis]
MVGIACRLLQLALIAQLFDASPAADDASWNGLLSIAVSADDDSWRSLPPHRPNVSCNLLLRSLGKEKKAPSSLFLVSIHSTRHDAASKRLFRSCGSGGVSVRVDHRSPDVLWVGKVAADGRPLLLGDAMPLPGALPQSIGSVLARHSPPRDFDVLVIAVDFFDLAILRRIMEAGYAPKIAILQANLDVPPPFRWSLGYDPYFKVPAQTRGHSGWFTSSPDNVFLELSAKRGYSFVSFEGLGAGGDLMWFVRSDLVHRNLSHPLVSWRGMVRMFWAHVGGSSCRHLRAGCPRENLAALAASLGSQSAKSPAELSFLLAQAGRNGWQQVVDYGQELNSRLKSGCVGACRADVHLARAPVHLLPVSSGLGDVTCWRDESTGQLRSRLYRRCCKDPQDTAGQVGCWSDESLTFRRCCLDLAPTELPRRAETEMDKTTMLCQKSQSQLGEEEAVISYFGWEKKQHGVYVEIGAMEGFHLSNTIRLHTCLNWSGILVEGSPQAFSGLQRNAAHYRVRNVQVHLGAVCAPPRTHLTFTTRNHFYGAPMQGDIEQLPPMLREMFPEQYNSSTVETPCKPMSWYLRSVSHVDFFSLDVEGSELEVLETIDFRAVTIEVFMVEFLEQSPKTWKIQNLLANLGYLECRKRGVEGSILFVRESGPYTALC